MSKNRCIICNANYWAHSGNEYIKCRNCGHSKSIKEKIIKTSVTLSQYKIMKHIETSLCNDDNNKEEVTIVDHNPHEKVLDLVNPLYPKSKILYNLVKEDSDGDFLLVCTNEKCTSSPRLINMKKTGGISKEILENGCTACGNKNLQFCSK